MHCKCGTIIRLMIGQLLLISTTLLSIVSIHATFTKYITLLTLTPVHHIHT